MGDQLIAALKDVSLSIEKNEYVALMGPSGSGKSTLMNILGCLDSPTSGSYRLNNSEVSSMSDDELAHVRNKEIGFVFQTFNLLPRLSSLENVALPLELMGVDEGERLARARRALGEVGLSEAEGRYPSQLSGGMRMRVSLARALVTSPKLLLLDEPFAALDENTRFRLDTQLRDLWIERGMTVVFVTHSITEAAFLADRAIVLTRRGCGVKLDRRLALPRRRDNALRLSPQLADEMHVLLGAMEEEG